MKKDFNEWLNDFIPSIADWAYYTNFPKVYSNVEKIKVELNLLNSLINSRNIEAEFRVLVAKYPEVLKVVPILIAKREYEINVTDKGVEKCFNFKKLNYTIDEYVKFMYKTGLFDLLQNNLISNLLDYVKGVEVGLDTNARKNRTGTAMENIVEDFILDAGFLKDVNYFKEMKKTEIKSKFKIDLNFMFDDKTKAEKRFDFVIKTSSTVYAIETNFYSSSGSKLNETARSYKMIAEETKTIKGFKFIWITDGKGWIDAKNNLKETFDVLDDIYNINELKDGILNKIIK